jgi:hypothetical protein
MPQDRFDGYRVMVSERELRFVHLTAGIHDWAARCCNLVQLLGDHIYRPDALTVFARAPRLGVARNVLLALGPVHPRS